MDYGLSHEKILLTQVLSNNTPKKTIKLVFHGLFCNLQSSEKLNTVTKLKTKKLLFLNESFAVRINVYVLLHGLRSSMKTNYVKEYILLMKSSIKKLG